MGRVVSLDTIFTLLFGPFLTQLLHLPLLILIFFPYVYLSYVSPCSWQNDKDTIQLVMVQDYLLPTLAVGPPHDHLATESLKQSISNSTTRSCASTPLVIYSTSHQSKFRTSQTRSTSRSASTMWRPWLIARFLRSTTARSPQPWASIQRTAFSDLLRDKSLLTGTGKVVALATRFTATSSYRIMVKMVNLPEEALGGNAALASTYGKGNKARNDRVGDPDL